MQRDLERIVKGARYKYILKNPLWNNDFKIGDVFVIYYSPSIIENFDPPPITREEVVGICPIEGAAHLFYITPKSLLTYFEMIK